MKYINFFVMVTFSHFIWVVYYIMLIAAVLRCTSYNAMFSGNQTRSISQNPIVFAALDRFRRFITLLSVFTVLDILYLDLKVNIFVDLNKSTHSSLKSTADIT